MANTLRWGGAAALLALAACGTAGTVASGGAPGEDVVRLTTGETVRGRIVEEDARRLLVQRDDRVLALPRGAVYSVDYSRETFERSKAPEPAAAPPPAPASARPASGWIPRTSPSEPFVPTEVLWFDGHAAADCVGVPFERALRELPDFRLYAEPGGKIVLHDPRRWGYHAHLEPGGFRRPLEKPGLSLELPREERALPEAVTFVSPAQEIKSGERTSYTPPDVLRAAIRPASEAEGSLAGQPFSGARPAATRNGSLWAFGLPRNPKQFVVWLLDPARKHGEILKASFAGYGDAVLAPDLIVDSVGADGVLIGRVLVVPYPDGAPVDGPAPEAVTVYSGPVQDPTEVVRLPLPPRSSILPPAAPPSVSAAVLVSHFDVSPHLPQAATSLWGSGRLSGDVRLSSQALTAKEADQVVRVDLGGLPEERFPAVAWLHVRRTYAWRSAGGRLVPGDPIPAPPARKAPKLVGVKRSDAVPHVVPILFQGPRPSSGGGSAAAESAVRVAGGMSEALVADALLRERGGSAAPAPAQSSSSADAGSYSNVTNLTVVVPPHDPVGGALGGAPALPATAPGGIYLSSVPGWGGPKPIVNPTTGQSLGGGVFGAIQGVEQGGVYYGTDGSVLYDPATGRLGRRP